tara:strand:+ start:16569 stop:17294 length:726 start_codon:yes stop_codon:yes gene_type:complete
MSESFKYTIIVLAKNENILLCQKINELTSHNIKNFLIIVANYGSINLPPDKRIKILNNCCNGIYDSMNQAVKNVTTKYYIVAGLDDEILIRNISKVDFKRNDHDIIICRVIKDNKEYSYFRPNMVVRGPTGVFPSHTVGLLIKTSLHDKYGMYSPRFKVISDCYFIGKAILGGCTCKLINLTSGIVGSSGYSFQNQFLSEKECYEVRKEFGLCFPLNYFLYVIRISRRLIKINVYKTFKNI